MSDINNTTFLQCQYCGEIFIINEHIPIERMYIKYQCQKCGETEMLNCGYTQEDVYELMNINIDQRYYN